MVAPFAVSSYYIDRYGIEVEGRVYHKSEYLRSNGSPWDRVATVTVEYWPPDGAGIAYFDTTLDTAAYDSFHKGQSVAVHYLRQRDLPRIPMAQALGQMRLLPVARLAQRSIFSGFDTFIHGSARGVLRWIAAAALLLIVWRVAGWPRFAWAVAVCVLAALAAALIHEFPTPTPAPVAQVLQATGRVTSIYSIEKLFQSRRSRGFVADQPVQVVAVEFVPSGRTEPVVAIDLIDKGSVANLKQEAVVPVDYEAAAPRTAYIHSATRTFASANLRGIAVESALSLALIVAFIVFASWLGGLWNRLLRRTAGPKP